MHHLSCTACSQTVLLRSIFRRVAPANSWCVFNCCRCLDCVFSRPKKRSPTRLRLVANIPEREYRSARIEFQNKTIYFGDVGIKQSAPLNEIRHLLGKRASGCALTNPRVSVCPISGIESFRVARSANWHTGCRSKASLIVEDVPMIPHDHERVKVHWHIHYNWCAIG